MGSSHLAGGRDLDTMVSSSSLKTGKVLSSSGRLRQRGLFPIPVPRSRYEGDFSGISRTVARRLGRHSHVDRWVQDVAISLNEMYAGQGGDFSPSGSIILSQQLCLDRIRSAVLMAGSPPADVNGREALAELRAKAGYEGEPSHLAPFQLERVSLPHKGSDPASLEKILRGDAQKFLERLNAKVLSESEARENFKSCGLRAPYSDPVFRSNPRIYADFNRRLAECGLVEFRLTCTETVGAFTVHKKNNRQRLVIDSRLANLHFRTPEKVHLATGAAFARLTVDEGPPVEVGGVDISDAFYNIQLPQNLRQFFGLKALKARDAGVTETSEGACKPDTLVVPVLRVVPMGWTHALWICQSIHEHLALTIPGIVENRRLVDKRAAPEMNAGGGRDFVHTEYVDNFVALSQKPGLCFELAERVGHVLNERGLPTHPVEAGVGLETLGWKFDERKPMVRVTSKRLWRLRLATQELLRVNKASGRDIERLVGHFTFAGLLRRGFLSIFQATYVFIRKEYTNMTLIWPEVRRELFWASSLICLVDRDLSAQWSTRIYATDASEYGRGVVATDRQLSDIKEVGKYVDRWKFSSEGERKVVNHDEINLLAQVNLETLSFNSDRDDDVGVLGDSGVPEVPLDFIGEDRSKIDSGFWERSESIPVLEGRAIVWAAQHLVRSQKNHGRRHLILTDSMSASLAIAKGRSSARGLNRVCRQIAALEFASGTYFTTRWIASELNPADLPSRAADVAQFNLKEAYNKFVQSYAAQGFFGQVKSWRWRAIQFYEQNINAPSKSRHESTKHEEPKGKQSRRGDPSEKEEGHSSRKTLCRSSEREDFGNEEFLGAAGGINSSGGLVSFGLGEISSESSSDQIFQSSGSGKVRSSRHQSPQSDVLGGGRSVSSFDSSFSSGLLHGRNLTDQSVAKDGSMHERIQETGSLKGKGANTISNAMPGVRGDDSEHAISDGLVVDDHLGSLCKARGDVEAGAQTRGEAISVVQKVDHCPQLRGASGNPGNFKSGGIRRGLGDRSRVPAMVGAGSDEVNTEQRSVNTAVSFSDECSHPRISKGSEVSSVRSAQCGVRVSNPARGRINRCAAEASDPRTGAKTGKMGNHEFREKVLKRRSNQSSVSGAIKEGSRKGNLSREADCKDFRSIPGASKSHESLMGLELFSGSGHMSHALRSQLTNVWCVEVDIALGPQFDLSVRKHQQEIIKLLFSKRIVYVWLGTPCNSWSRARRWDGKGPGPLRDDHDYIYGLPGLSHLDSDKVRLGNNLMRFSAKVFRICLDLGIPVALENPYTSRLWLAPPMKHLLQHKLTDFCYTDFCQAARPGERGRVFFLHTSL